MQHRFSGEVLEADDMGLGRQTAQWKGTKSVQSLISRMLGVRWPIPPAAWLFRGLVRRLPEG
jgi:hypothetical protein